MVVPPGGLSSSKRVVLRVVKKGDFQKFPKKFFKPLDLFPAVVFINQRPVRSADATAAADETRWL